MLTITPVSNLVLRSLQIAQNDYYIWKDTNSVEYDFT